MGKERDQFFKNLPPHLNYEPYDTVKVGEHLIGADQPTFIIAELGGNHGGSLELALEGIDAAAAAGCDAIKFQHLTGTEIANDSTVYEEWHDEPVGTLSSFYTKAEMPYEWTDQLVARAKEKGIMFLSTPFDTHAVDVLDAADVSAFKIASYELTDDTLVRYVAKKGRPMIISTGTAYLEEVAHAVRIIQEEGNNKIIVLHCVSMYPPKDADLNLRAITTMQQALRIPVGFSDHAGPETMAASIAAVTLGACVIERHFTLEEAGKTNDSPNSLSPDQLAHMVQEIRKTERMLSGSGIKQPVSRGTHTGEDSDEIFERYAHRSVHAARDIAAGEILTTDMCKTLRPYGGIRPKDISFFIGKKVLIDVPARAPLTPDVFLA